MTSRFISIPMFYKISQSPSFKITNIWYNYRITDFLTLAIFGKITEILKLPKFAKIIDLRKWSKFAGITGIIEIW